MLLSGLCSDLLGSCKQIDKLWDGGRPFGAQPMELGRRHHAGHYSKPACMRTTTRNVVSRSFGATS